MGPVRRNFRDDYETAARFAREAVRICPGEAYLHFILSAAVWQSGDADAGLAELEIAARLKPEWDRPHADIGVVLMNVRRHEEAVRRLEAATFKLEEPSWWLTLVLARAHEHRVNAREAIGCYERPLELEPDRGEAHDRVAQLYFNEANTLAAIDRCKKGKALGYAAVHTAWRRGYYKGKGQKERPPQTASPDRVVFSDRPWKHAPDKG